MPQGQSLEDSLRFGVGDRKDSEVFSFRQYLSYFGIVDEPEVQHHFNRVLRLEEITGLKMRLDWYDPFKEKFKSA